MARILVVRLIWTLVGLGLVASVPPSLAAARTSQSAAHLSGKKVRKLRKELLHLINAGRAQRGIPKLTLSRKESSCAAAHSRAMAAQGSIFHGIPGDICIAFAVAGENIGEASGTPLAAVRYINHEMWAEGPCPRACPAGSALWMLHGHYLNLTNGAFHRVGLGFAIASGVTWLTEVFTN